MAATQVFQLSEEREAALWRLAEALALDAMTSSAASLVKACCEGGRDLASHQEGFGAAAQLAYELRKGSSIQFVRRPSANKNDSRGMGSPSGAEVDFAQGVI